MKERKSKQPDRGRSSKKKSWKRREQTNVVITFYANSTVELSRAADTSGIIIYYENIKIQSGANNPRPPTHHLSVNSEASECKFHYYNHIQPRLSVSQCKEPTDISGETAIDSVYHRQWALSSQWFRFLRAGKCFHSTRDAVASIPTFGRQKAFILMSKLCRFSRAIIKYFPMLVVERNRRTVMQKAPAWEKTNSLHEASTAKAFSKWNSRCEWKVWEAETMRFHSGVKLNLTARLPQFTLQQCWFLKWTFECPWL